jgi:hypothetical protein
MKTKPQSRKVGRPRKFAGPGKSGKSGTAISVRIDPAVADQIPAGIAAYRQKHDATLSRAGLIEMGLRRVLRDLLSPSA